MTAEPVLETPPFQVLLYYLYVPISDPAEYMERHRALCEELELRGRIIIGEEGINGTVSGTFENTQAYVEAMNSDPLTAAMEFKIDPAESHVFPKLSVKVREEIVTLGLPKEEDIDPNEVTGDRLSPSEWLEAMQEEEVVIIDGRNLYEAELGKFKGAVVPDIDSFREFPEWLREHREELQQKKKILTYCTGGIRCEKLSGFLKKEGFDNVYQVTRWYREIRQRPEGSGTGFRWALLCF